jgi:hypothetical protein
MRGHRPQFFVASCRALLQESYAPSLVRKYGTVSPVSAGPTPQSVVFERAVEANAPRNNWTKEEIKEIYDTPLMKLAFAAVRQSVWKLRNQLIQQTGHSSQEISQPRFDPDVYPHEYQDWRLQ